MKSFGGMQACRAAVCIAMLAGLGPRPVWAGDNVWTSLGPDGGSITALVIDPQNTSTVYAATGNGVFKTTDKGASWTAANAGLPADLIQAVVIDPQNTGTLYASILSHGVFKSKDGGVSWNPAGSGLPTYSSDVTGYQEVPALVIDPRHPDTLYAAIGDDPLSRGIYKTINGGGNWTAVNSGLPSRSPGYNVASLAIDPQDTNLLYAAVDLYSQQQTLNPGVIFRSADGGASWAATAAGLPGFSHYDLGPAPLLIDPRNSSTLYAGTASAGVWKSTDRGTSWFAVNSGVPADYVRTLGLALDPQNTGTIYMISSPKGEAPGGLFKSIDGGMNWLQITSGPDGDDFNPQDGCSCYSALAGLAIDPVNQGTVYIGTNGAGVFRSADDGAHWRATDAGLRAVSGSLAINPQDSRTLYLASWNRVYQTADAGIHWSAGAWGVPQARLAGLKMDPQTPGTMYVWTAATEDGGYFEFFKTVDGGRSWSQLDSNPHWYGLQDLAIDPHNSTTVYAGAAAGMYKSRDGGLTWVAMGPTISSPFWLPSPPTVYSIAIDPQDSRTIYVGGYYVKLLSEAPFAHGAYEIYKTTDGGETWSELRSGLADCCSFGVLAIDPQRTETLYAASAAGAFKSTDRGANWNQLSSGLPLDTPSVSSLVIDPLNSSILYVATGGSVFRSTDGGADWTPLNSGLPPGSVGTLAIDSQNSSKVYGVGNGGVFAITVTRDMDRSSKDVEK